MLVLEVFFFICEFLGMIVGNEIVIEGSFYRIYVFYFSRIIEIFFGIWV